MTPASNDVSKGCGEPGFDRVDKVEQNLTIHQYPPTAADADTATTDQRILFAIGNSAALTCPDPTPAATGDRTRSIVRTGRHLTPSTHMFMRGVGPFLAPPRIGRVAPMASSGRAVLSTMLDRLLAGLMAGPNMNCRPHASRQRVDLTQLSRLADATPESVLLGLLGPDESARVVAKVKPPRKRERAEGEPESPHERAFREQQALVAKLRVIADEARTYENDTGVAALAVGFPLLSVPPAAGESKRILAPVAFVPVSLAMKVGATPAAELACKSESGDRIRPNAALLAWIEQQTGHAPPPENDDDADPWGELHQLIEHVVTALGVANPFTPSASPDGPGEPEVGVPPSISPTLRGGSADEGPPVEDLSETPAERGANGTVTPPVRKITPSFAFTLQPSPRVDDPDDGPRIVSAAVLGLFPVPNQGLLRDTRAMMSEDPAGPVRAFLTAGIDFDAPPADAPAAPLPTEPTATPAWLAAAADPCQARAVALARDSAALVVHGPPGTGKSQTITNVIADHLCRGHRVLLVCDKRTALDVVADRLGKLGLRRLCGIVHDPRRDQRDLYRTLKQQLDELSDAKTKPRAEGQLNRVDAELRGVHDELLAYHGSLMSPVHGEPSFSDLVGRWLAAGTDASVRLDESAAAGVTVEAVTAHRATLVDLFERARSVDLPRNPWAKCGGAVLADYLARPMAAVRTALARCVAAAETADATIDPAMPPFNDAVPLVEQGRARAAWGARVAALLPDVRQVPGLIGLAKQRAEDVRQAMELELRKEATLQGMRGAPLDAELSAALIPLPSPAEVNRQLVQLQAYADRAKRWTAVFNFSGKAAATKVLARYGQPLSPAAAERVVPFLTGVKHRLALAGLRATAIGEPPPTTLPADAVLEQHSATVVGWGQAVLAGLTDPALAGASEPLARAASDPVAMEPLLSGLAASPARAEAVNRLEEELLTAGLFGPAWLADFAAQQRRGEPATEPITTLAGRADSLEGVLRVHDARAAVPVEMGPAVDALVTQGADPAVAVAALDRAAVEGSIARRLRADPNLQRTDARKVESLFDQYRQLADRRRELVRDAVEHHWVSKQKDRLLAAAGTKLNGLGADLKRRLTTRGERAQRLRQVVAKGEHLDGGDPLFDLCPVWMASPETVAQVFPRRPIFDVVIFDEASQCRLEEALPVLVRAQRALIAGDPHQLPPTRFFESGFVRSGEDDEEDDTEQSLFEAHQAQVEDLLSAALNLSVRQCYLDVHYRSRSADLIAFSNRHFYGGRLVPIPTVNAAGEAAVQLRRVDGVYENRRNPAEADAVVEIVKELLARPDPPSVGVACLNLPQRDLIVERLDAAAEDDAKFAKRLAAARARSGGGAADGLFVKNLENVQGDERDEIIISTTYGRRPDGKFHRRFGPLGMPGGGRRLNVLVTRARDRIHLVTSIPTDAYRSLPPVPEGAQPGGAWLLFAYLRFADELAAGQPSKGDGRADAQRPDFERSSSVGPTRYPSAVAEQLATRLAGVGVGADVYWGNDGFCVDLVPHGGGSTGVLVDGCRYAAVDDAVDWDVFRTGVLSGQGWRLTRVWSPHLFRDPEGTVKAVSQSARPSGATSPP